MSCRETPAGSALTTLSRLNARLTDQQIQSLFHKLRKEYIKTYGRRKPGNTSEYRSIIAISKEHALTDDLTEARRAKVLARLEKAEEQSTPTADIVYALKRIRRRAEDAAEKQEHWIAQIAARLGSSSEEVSSKFSSLVASVERSRGQTFPEYTTENRKLAKDKGLIDELGTVHAMLILEKDALAAEANRALTLPRRIERVDFNNSETGIPGLTITEAGWDPRNGRLEILLTDIGGEQTEFSYHNVPEELWLRMARTEHVAGRVWFDHIRGNSEYAYADEISDNLDRAAPRCPACGEFASTSHSCPVSTEPKKLTHWNTRNRWSKEEDPSSGVLVSMPAKKIFREAVLDGPVTVEGFYETFTVPGENGYPSTGLVSGSVNVFTTGEEKLVNINTVSLNCTCIDYQPTEKCPHITVVESAVRSRIADSRLRVRSGGRLSEETIRAAMAAKRSDWTRFPSTAQEAASTWRTDSTVLYSEDYEAFYRDYRDSLQAPIPYDLVNALDGECTRESGNAFGVELEFEFPDTMTSEEISQAKTQIGKELYELGLTSQADQQEWRNSSTRGYRDTHEGNWSYEKDGTVNGGEIVTPGMYDEPETWQHIQNVCNILTRNGAIASKKAGSHIHVGTGFYDGDMNAYAELARLFTQHEDSIYRLSANPNNGGKHRSLKFCRPNNTVPAGGFTETHEPYSWHNRDRYYGLNFAHVKGENTDHPEFRIFDASLDPAVIQAQVKLSVGMTRAAKRLSDTGVMTRRGKDTLGSHAKRSSLRGTRRISKEELVEDSATTRSLIDTLFSRREDKKHLVSIFARTKWVKKSKIPASPEEPTGIPD